MKKSTIPIISSHRIPLGREFSPSASATAQVSMTKPVVGKARDQKADIDGLNDPFAPRMPIAIDMVQAISKAHHAQP